MKKTGFITLPLTLLVLIAFAVGLTIPFTLVQYQAEAAEYQNDYYSSVTALNGNALLGQLHDLTVSTHKYYSTYDDCHYKGSITDPGQGNNTVLEFYTHIDISYSQWANSGGWNREHVWPKSLSNGLWKTVGSSARGGGSDLHHIRPAETDLNSRRGNKLYGEVSNGSPQYTSGSVKALGGYADGSVFEPLDNVKGDVARIIMYVYTHYNKASAVNGTVESAYTSGNLPITNIISAGGTDRAWDLLLRWNKMDPVDDIERNRNEAVYEIQGNRNPFIDNESYADAIWGGGTVEKEELTGLSVTPNSLSLETGAKQTLTVRAIPSNANASVTWASSNTEVATINNGIVTAVGEGSAVITATSVENPSITATVQITVTSKSTNPNPPVNPDPPIDPDPPVNPDPPVVGGDVQQFISAVSAINSAQGMESKFNAIKNAVTEYNKLSAADKNADSVKTQYQVLLNAIADYNAQTDSFNNTMDSATKSGAYMLSAVSLAAVALVAVLQRKFR